MGEHLDEQRPEGDGPVPVDPRIFKFAGVILLVLLALFVTFGAYVTEWVACEFSGSDACDRQDLAETQRTIALLGLIPTAVMAVTAFRAIFRSGSKRVAWLFLGVTLVTYAVWAVLNDAAVHGWGRDMLFVP